MKDMCNKTITGITLQEDGIGFTLSDDNRDEDMLILKTMPKDLRDRISSIELSADGNLSIYFNMFRHILRERKIMSDQPKIDVNKICKAIDALTKEIHLLRKDLNRRDRFESSKEIKSEELEFDGLDKMPKI